ASGLRPSPRPGLAGAVARLVPPIVRSLLLAGLRLQHRRLRPARTLLLPEGGGGEPVRVAEDDRAGDSRPRASTKRGADRTERREPGRRRTGCLRVHGADG